ncbi:hypothetical protein ACFZB5_24210 [Streptomyces nodosus]|uniref:hypothetical protein n=1 Tax=Streptomyces nodosus TaxID=40318 RepID=UPI0036E79FFD
MRKTFPVPSFSRLGVTEIQQCLYGLSQRELMLIEDYERAHAGRPGVLNAIQRLREAEPWADYTTMDPERIKIHLHNVSADVVRRVLEYERHHRRCRPRRGRPGHARSGPVLPGGAEAGVGSG